MLMCGVFGLLILFAPLIWAAGISGWNDTFILCSACLFTGILLRWFEHRIICLPFFFIGIVGIAGFFLGWY